MTRIVEDDTSVERDGAFEDHDILWETMVPTPIAIAIKRRGLFGHVNISHGD
jgi:hypothetical protein